MRKRKFWKFNLKVPDIIILLICAFSFALIVFSTENYYNESLFSLAARILVLLNLCFFGFTILMKKGIKTSTWKNIVFIIIMFVAAIFSYLIGGGPSPVDYLIIIFGYLAIPLYCITAQEAEILDLTKSFITVFAVTVAVFYIYLTIFNPVYFEVTGALSFGYSNSNRAGAYLMLVGALLLCCAERTKSFIKKLVLWGFAGSILYIITLTQCRTAFFILLGILIYSILPIVPKVGKKFLIACSLITLAFSWLYIYLYDHGWFQTLEVFGKSIYTGRQELFESEFLGFSLFGFFGKSGFSGLNLGIGLLNGFGIIGTLLFYIFILRFGSQLVSASRLSENQKTFSIFCFGALMLHSCTEVSLFTGGSVYAALMGLILIMMELKPSPNNHLWELHL